MASLEAELRSRSDIIEGIGAITVSVDAGEHDQNALGGFQKKIHGRPVGTGTAGHPSGSVVVVVRSARRPPLAIQVAFMLWPQVLERTQVIVKEQFKVRSLLSGDS
jgi:hypothetical protein